MIPKRKIIETAKNLDNILKEGNPSLVDEFEKEFSELEYSLEHYSSITYGNRQLVRKTYLLIVYLYGEYADLYDFENVVKNIDGEGRLMVINLAREHTNDTRINRRYKEICKWFSNDYYSNADNLNTVDYINCLQTRYLIEKFITALESDNYEFLRVMPDKNNNLFRRPESKYKQ